MKICFKTLFFVIILLSFGCKSSKDMGKVDDKSSSSNPPIKYEKVLLVDEFTNEQHTFRVVDFTVEENDLIKINVQYGGGCKEHDFDLQILKNKQSDSIIDFNLVHNTKNDYCKKMVLDELTFDLSPITNKVTAEKTIRINGSKSGGNTLK